MIHTEAEARLEAAAAGLERAHSELSALAASQYASLTASQLEELQTQASAAIQAAGHLRTLLKTWTQDNRP